LLKNKPDFADDFTGIICYYLFMKENRLDTNREFSFIKRAKSFTYAGRGIWIFLKTTHNAWIHLVVFAMAVIFGFCFSINYFEWITLVIVGGLVLVSEAFNTAIEIDIDLTSPSYHPYAKDTKDVAAGAVLISAIIALIVGIIIFGHHFVSVFIKFW
jgi:diacylglycerol kinase (ATP)